MCCFDIKKCIPEKNTQNQDTNVISELEETQEEERSGKTSFFKSARLYPTVLTYCSLTDWSNPLRKIKQCILNVR